MPNHRFSDRNPRSTAVLTILANGLPDALDFGRGPGNQGNANQRTERTAPIDATTRPAQPPRTAPFGGNSNLLLIGGAVLVGIVLLARR